MKKDIQQRLEDILTAWLPYYRGDQKGFYIANNKDIKQVCQIILNDNLLIQNIKNSNL